MALFEGTLANGGDGPENTINQVVKENWNGKEDEPQDEVLPATMADRFSLVISATHDVDSSTTPSSHLILPLPFLSLMVN